MTRNELTAVGIICVTLIAITSISVGSSESFWPSAQPAVQLSPRVPRPVVRPPIVQTTVEQAPLTNCLPASAANGAKIAVLGAYEGDTETALAIGSEDNATTTIAVAANANGPPMVVIVSAYDPVIWDFRQVPAGRIRAVIAYGYANQAVAGLPARTPVRFVSYTTPNLACGSPTYAYEGGRNLDELASNIRAITRREPDSFQGSYDPTGFHLDGDAAPDGRIDGLASSGLRAAVTITQDHVPPGAEGLVALINAGKLRPANAADFSKLSNALSKGSLTRRFAPVKIRMPRGAYVVLAQTTMPKGMYGAHSATFLIPSGVPMPSDAGSHNTYFMLKDGGCVGSGCGSEGG